MRQSPLNASSKRKLDRASLEAARSLTVPDLIAKDLSVLFCGINPGLYSAAVGHHFARPGNRFWPALHRSGMTPRQLSPDEEKALLPLGFGITNLVERATARADELSAEELVAGGRQLVRKVHRFVPRYVAFVGVGAYRTAFGDKRAGIGRQSKVIGNSLLWVLPNPSGLNAHFDLDGLAREFAGLAAAVRNGL